jgi:hypothetical protein
MLILVEMAVVPRVEIMVLRTLAVEVQAQVEEVTQELVQITVMVVVEVVV